MERVCDEGPSQAQEVGPEAPQHESFQKLSHLLLLLRLPVTLVHFLCLGYPRDGCYPEAVHAVFIWSVRARRRACAGVADAASQGHKVRQTEDISNCAFTRSHLGN